MPSVLDLISTLAPPAFNAINQRRATTSATRNLTGGVDRARDIATSNADQLRKLYDPFRNAGVQDLNAIQTGLQPGGEFQPYDKNFSFEGKDLANEKGYQFDLAEGQKAIDAARRAMGTRFSGGAVKEAVKYQTDYADTKFNSAFDRSLTTFNSNEKTFRQNQDDRFNRLKGIVDTGANATNNEGAQLTRNSEQLADLEQQRAEAEASGDIGKASAITKAIDAGVKSGAFEQLAGVVKKGLGLGGAAASGTAAIGASFAPPAIGTVAAGIAPNFAAQMAAIGAPTLTGGAAAAAAPATGVTGALGLGGGSGVLGLGAATIPVVGGIIAGGLLLAKHYVGAGRKQADKLTGEGGLQRAFEATLKDIDNAPEYSPAQKWQSKTQAYEELEKRVIEFAGKGKNQRKVAVQMFDEISHLFGRRNPLKG